ncbi:hypothetical protein [Lysinibacillus sphaericus]|uniref:hypothetical protein n=1 Tax=Lysinibacillus sphaericus TaxID=1421 RepID=UPI001CC018C1|nr:hypothetical protein [Lysinibacillus sphaericus]
MPLHSLSEDELRSICKKKVESLEYWLRRIIHEKFTNEYGADYFTKKLENDESVIKGEISKKARARREEQPNRYSRNIDATLLDDLIAILCNRRNYTPFFKEAFHKVAPLGNEQLKHVLSNIWECRNPLSHANPISIRQAEQLLCYSNDIIDSLKEYYKEKGEETLFNVPTILKYVDSLGNTFYREQMNDGGNGVSLSFRDDANSYLRAGEIFSIEVEIDPSFEESDYEIVWRIRSIKIPNEESNKLTITLENHHVGDGVYISCEIISKKDWHKWNGYDDELTIGYKVLPPF